MTLLATPVRPLSFSIIAISAFEADIPYGRLAGEIEAQNEVFAATLRAKIAGIQYEIASRLPAPFPSVSMA